MRKLKIYLDTSVISHLYQLDAPEKMNETIALWEQIKQGKYDVYLSQVTLDEVYQCNEEKLEILRNHMADIDFTLLDIDTEDKNIALKFIENGILTNKSLSDCYHIASAMKNGCDVIISWNFKHICNIKTIKGVKIVSGITNYPEVAIYSPPVLAEGRI